MKVRNKNIDILCVGETLIDFIGTQLEAPIEETKDYHRYLGGSPTNVAMNMSRLGLRVKMVATVGQDGFGNYILGRLNEANIDTSTVKVIGSHPSTVIFVNRSLETPEFIALRGADRMITKEQFSLETIAATKIFHTTCFALSMQPARDSILAMAPLARERGCELSIDLNYSEKIWANTEEALESIKRYCSFGALVKVSEDDMDRLFKQRLSHKAIFEHLHGFGAKVVCLTLGKNGAKLSNQGKDTMSIPAMKLEKILDATGAGDAFWSGFLFARIKGKSNEACMRSGMQMAAIKLLNVGRIPDYARAISELMKF